MNRKQFVESVGATCSNWRWSWSFVNDLKQFVLFGAWDVTTSGNTTLILSEAWERGTNGRRQPAYSESREHLRLVEEAGYQLFTYPLEHSDEKRDAAGVGPSAIRSFGQKLDEKSLQRIGPNWYASGGVIGGTLPEEVGNPQEYLEGTSTTVSINAFERNAGARAACIDHHGCHCAVCQFEFSGVYGDIGEGYIHVHHVVPLCEVEAEYAVDPVVDLIPVCPNCHAMIHRTTPPLSVDALRAYLQANTGSVDSP